MRPARVVRIEDSADEVALSVKLMQLQGLAVEIDCVADPTELFETWKGDGDRLPDIAVVDLRLPGMSGIDLIQKIRAEKAYDRVLIGVCSGSVDLDERRAATAAGAAFFVEKPFALAGVEAICAADPRFWIEESEGRKHLLCGAEP